MPLIDKAEFERGRKEAAAYWGARGDKAAAEAFLALEIAGAEFGLDATARLAWHTFRDVQVGLRFDIESGAYASSFIRRTKR